MWKWDAATVNKSSPWQPESSSISNIDGDAVDLTKMQNMTLQERTLVDESTGDDNAGHDSVGQDNDSHDNDGQKRLLLQPAKNAQ